VCQHVAGSASDEILNENQAPRRCRHPTQQVDGLLIAQVVHKQ
jgi:hypothetical protein